MSNARYHTRCRSCGGLEIGHVAAGVRAWVCVRCNRASLRITDLAVWSQIRDVFFPEAAAPLFERKPDRVYVLRKPEKR